MAKSKEPSTDLLEMDTDHVMDFSLRRDEAGNYKIHYTGIFNYQSILRDGQRVWAFPDESLVRQDFDLVLSFDAQDGKPILQFEQPPRLSGKVTLSGWSEEEFSKLNGLSDPFSGQYFTKYTELSGVIHDLTVQHLIFETDRPDDAVTLLRSRVITEEDVDLLELFGFNSSTITQMIAGCVGDENTPHLGKELIQRLVNPATRNAAVDDLRAMAEAIVKAGLLGSVPDIHPEVLNLISVAGLSIRSFASHQSDVEMVHKFITESKDPSVRSLLLDMASSDPEKVETAKASVQELSRTLRRERGLELLTSHVRGVTGEHIRYIQKHIPEDRYRDMLKHLADRDEFFDDAVRGFESIVESVKTLVSEEYAKNHKG